MVLDPSPPPLLLHLLLHADFEQGVGISRQLSHYPKFVCSQRTLGKGICVSINYIMNSYYVLYMFYFILIPCVSCILYNSYLLYYIWLIHESYMRHLWLMNEFVMSTWVCHVAWQIIFLLYYFRIVYFYMNVLCSTWCVYTCMGWLRLVGSFKL